MLVLFPWKGAAIPYGGANTGVETAAGVELSGAVYRLSDGAGVQTRAVGTGDCGGRLALLARRVVLSVDWTLLLVFMAMFIDVHLLTQLPALQGVLGNVSHLSEPGLWLTAIGLSQVISNVPSTILLLNYVPPSYYWYGR
ncbi:transporter [Escherichia coli]|uniref:Transporter n=1 Tax=Escherichia coli TaxID=562 RepID=A0A376ZS98_ECOLX|nr:transporter [Escherichia coli]